MGICANESSSHNSKELSMEIKIRFHIEAEKELLDSMKWYEEQSEGLGNRFFEAVKLRISAIQQNPERYKTIKQHYRETLVDKHFPFTIVYRYNKIAETITVAAIYHGFRNPRKKFRR